MSVRIAKEARPTTVQDITGMPTAWSQPVNMQELGKKVLGNNSVAKKSLLGRTWPFNRNKKNAEVVEVPQLFGRDDAQPLPKPSLPNHGAKDLLQLVLEGKITVPAERAKASQDSLVRARIARSNDEDSSPRRLQKSRKNQKPKNAGRSAEEVALEAVAKRNAGKDAFAVANEARARRGVRYQSRSGQR